MLPSPNPDLFFPQVWMAVREVPHGVVSTYGQIASIIPPPSHINPADYQHLGPKWVGEALNAVSFRDIDGQPISPGVPWWRIINSKGGISMPPGSNGALEQRNRLLQEDVRFNARGLVDLEEYGWEGPTDDWLTTHQYIRPKPLRDPNRPRQMGLF